MLRAALASLRGMVWRVIEVGGKVVSVLVPGPDPLPAPTEAVDELVDQAPTDPVAVGADRWHAIRELALTVESADPDTFIAAGGARVFNWLEAMPSSMRVTVSRASDVDLRQHITGQRALRGVLAFDEQSVAAYVKTTRGPSGVPQDAEFEPGVSLAY